MLVVMNSSASKTEVENVCELIGALGFEARAMPGGERTAIGLIGNDKPIDTNRFSGLPGVKEVIAVSAPYKQVSREWKKEGTQITLDNGVTIGGQEVVMMSGPCAVESLDQILETAAYVAASGGTILRGGAFKPRTSPYSFQGLGEDGLKHMAEARKRFNLAIITEAVDATSARLVAEYADIIQIGARNMQNYSLLKEIGRLGKPVMLKRGLSATIKEWLLAAEYILNEGNPDVILCERGIRSFDSSTRNVMDVGAIAMLKELSHLPVIADPSHATGRRDLIAPVARAAIAAGADGLIVETHPNPNMALSDGPQSLTPDQFSALSKSIAAIAHVVNRSLATLPPPA
jgi:3-deoxy-7-phosphoheptulonate synthase